MSDFLTVIHMALRMGHSNNVQLGSSEKRTSKHFKIWLEFFSVATRFKKYSFVLLLQDIVLLQSSGEKNYMGQAPIHHSHEIA